LNGCLTVHRKTITDRLDLLTDATFDPFIIKVVEDIANEIAQIATITFNKASGGHGRCADPNAGRDKG
jgi:hypothetical protein